MDADRIAYLLIGGLYEGEPEAAARIVLRELLAEAPAAPWADRYQKLAAPQGRSLRVHWPPSQGGPQDLAEDEIPEQWKRALGWPMEPPP